MRDVRWPLRGLRLALAAAVGGSVLAGMATATAEAGVDDERALAERYAPVMRLVDQPDDCGPGEPYQPSNVDELMDSPSVALRGPWTQQDLIDVGPSADDLAEGLTDYALDFPGDPLSPGCSYEEWANGVWADSEPTVYAHVAKQRKYADRLALQYWFYYPFNDFNNKHESDWERIQIEFAVATPAEALDAVPVRVAYSQHDGLELAAWDDPKVEKVDETHPVVYVAAGSHSSHFASALYLGRSKTQGFGCDTTLEPTHAVEPVVETIPRNPDLAAKLYPWIGFEGHWGQRETRSFYDGPTGPNMKSQWTSPFSWSTSGEPRSYPVPGGGAYGDDATLFFCSIVDQSSDLFLTFNRNPLLVLGIIAVIGLLLWWLLRRVSWGSDPLPARQQRKFGQTVSVAIRMANSRPLLFLGIALPAVIVSVASSAVDQVLYRLSLVEEPGETPRIDMAGWLSIANLVAAIVLSCALLLAQAAVTRALTEIDAGRPIGVLHAYRLAFKRLLPLALTALVVVVILLASALTVVLIPFAVFATVAMSLFVPVVELEAKLGPKAVWRSWQLVRRQFLKIAGVLLVGLLLTSLLGGLLSTMLLIAVQTPFFIVNLIPGLVASLVLPFLALMIAYSYYHGVAREDAAEPPPADEPEPTPVPA